MKKTLLLTLALASALAHGETFDAPHVGADDKQVVLGGAGVALTPEVARLHEQAGQLLLAGKAREALPLRSTKNILPPTRASVTPPPATSRRCFIW